MRWLFRFFDRLFDSGKVEEKIPSPRRKCDHQWELKKFWTLYHKSGRYVEGYPKNEIQLMCNRIDCADFRTVTIGGDWAPDDIRKMIAAGKL